MKATHNAGRIPCVVKHRDFLHGDASVREEAVAGQEEFQFHNVKYDEDDRADDYRDDEPGKILVKEPFRRTLPAGSSTRSRYTTGREVGAVPTRRGSPNMRDTAQPQTIEMLRSTGARLS